nr:hypothetical protein CFP56_03593 [Quercus suber]
MSKTDLIACRFVIVVISTDHQNTNMGDLSTLAKARKELEEMYLGIPDDSVNLTFQDLAVATQNATDKKKSNSKELNPEGFHVPSQRELDEGGLGFLTLISVPSALTTSIYSGIDAWYIQRAGKVGCCNWRYPSMVKQVELMWAEKEPRRSGKRGYIQRAGKVGCCNWRYPSMVKQVELMWAEKEPRRSGKRGSGHNGVVSSRPRSPMNPRAHFPKSNGMKTKIVRIYVADFDATDNDAIDLSSSEDDEEMPIVQHQVEKQISETRMKYLSKYVSSRAVNQNAKPT